MHVGARTCWRANGLVQTFVGVKASWCDSLHKKILRWKDSLVKNGFQRQRKPRGKTPKRRSGASGEGPAGWNRSSPLLLPLFLAYEFCLIFGPKCCSMVIFIVYAMLAFIRICSNPIFFPFQSSFLFCYNPNPTSFSILIFILILFCKILLLFSRFVFILINLLIFLS